MSALSVSFFNEDASFCPACSSEFKIENMRSGGGRFNSTGIARDLRRIYVPTKKYGLIYPLIYNVIVCPKCWYAALPTDFFKKNFDFKKIKKSEELRKKATVEIVGKDLDFNQPRNLDLGLGSFFLATFCYNFFKVPSISSAHRFLCALRASWCADDFYDLNKDDFYQQISLYFKKLAFECLEKHMQNMYDTKENFIEVEYHGPDIDHNYGYDGFVYLNCYLGFFFSDLNHTKKEQYDLMMQYRNRLAKVFGMGKPDKSSPSPLKKAVRNTYDEIKVILNQIEEEDPSLKETF